MSLNSTERFSSRVANYIRYRPGYPAEILDLLKNECALRPEHVVADVACGTGIFARLLLENGNQVIGIEPNAEMHAAGKEFLLQYRNFISITETAEATTLPAESVNMVTAAQAAHWFDAGKASREFRRILKPGGWLVLVWNDRRMDSDFAKQYEQLLATYGTDYAQVRHQGLLAASGISKFFAPHLFHEATFNQEQEFDYAGLEGRLLSSSYAPEHGHPQHQPMLRALRELFETHQKNGLLTMEYVCNVYFGRLS